MMRLGLMAAVAALALPGTAFGATIYNNNVGSVNYLYDSSTDNGTTGALTADDFTLSTAGAATYSVTGATWSGSYYNYTANSAVAPAGATQMFELLFYASTGDRPAGSSTAADEGALVKRYVSVTPTGSGSVASYTSTFSPFTLQAGQQYWLSVYAIDPVKGDNWSWGGNSTSGNAIQSDGTNWSDDHAATDIGRMAFTLTGTVASVPAVPEPATWALMLVGLGGVGGSVRYRRRRTTLRFA